MPTTEDAKQKTEEEKPKKAPRKVAAKKPVKKESSVDAPVAEAGNSGGIGARQGRFVYSGARAKKNFHCASSSYQKWKGIVTINGREMEKYFSTYDVRDDVMSPLRAVGQETSVDVSAKVVGGGIRGQAQSCPSRNSPRPHRTQPDIPRRSEKTRLSLPRLQKARTQKVRKEISATLATVEQTLISKEHVALFWFSLNRRLLTILAI